MSGGVQMNVVPNEFTVGFDIRITPTTNMAEFEAQVITQYIYLDSKVLEKLSGSCEAVIRLCQGTNMDLSNLGCKIYVRMPPRAPQMCSCI